MAINVFLKAIKSEKICSSDIPNGTVFTGTIGNSSGLFRKLNLLIDAYLRKDYVIWLGENHKLYWNEPVPVQNYKVVDIEIKEV